ncbi:MAG: membrane protein insertion efficiency factor YidD [Candidatus Eisenbacteria bacterium]|uniref:Putative membrane protein insertion efficiency factor n=1 Tax=Eiseniibacteriota bacterium TaxID=2212470 RepID=A0A7Y2E9I3_UNCEI|nr:membrane protein insertion efficiency factor YidD [Candidatus Eisenbacteria bacterium]
MRLSLTSLPKQFAILLIQGYRRFISPLFPSVCRFHPTCSEYTLVAVREYGLLRGSWMFLKRLAKCHPFHPGGHDPVISKSGTELGNHHGS